MKSLVLSALVLVLATVREADACSCAPDTGIELSPSSGTTIPIGATIFVFETHDPSERHRAGTRVAARPREVRGAVVTRVELVMDDGDVSVTKLSLRATDSQVELVFDKTAREFRYVVGDPGERALKRPLASLWMDPTRCSDGGIAFELDGNAIAYQLDWEDGATTILRKRGSVIGGYGCLTTNIDRDKLAIARSFELKAWFVDGTTHYLGASRMKLDTDGAVLLPREFTPAPVPTPPAPPLDPCPLEIERPRWRLLVFGLVLGAVMASACWLSWLRLRR